MYFIRTFSDHQSLSRSECHKNGFPFGVYIPNYVAKSHNSPEINASTAGISGGNDMSMEEQHGRTEGAGYKVFEEEVREPLASLSHSSSSDGIWPPSCNRGLRTSTIGMQACSYVNYVRLINYKA